MRITIEVDDQTLAEWMKMIGEKKKSPAVSKAVEECVKRHRAKEFGRQLKEGYFDFPYTNDEIERQGM